MSGHLDNFMENKDKDLSSMTPQAKEPVTEPNTQEPTTEEPKTTEPQATEPKTTEPKTAPAELTNEQVLEYLNKDRENPFTSFDEVFAPKEVVKEVTKEVNPWQDVLDAEDLAYLDFKKETNGRSRKEYDFLKSDIENKSVLDLAIEKVKRDTGLNMTQDQGKAYLESKLNIDLETEELSSNDNIELHSFVKPFREQLLADKAKIKVPLEKKASTDPMEGLVKMDNGTFTTKENLQQQENLRTEYIKGLQDEANRVTSFDFDIELSENGEKRVLEVGYEPSKEDRHSMVSDASDIDGWLKNRFGTKDGINHMELKKGLWLSNPENVRKVVTAAVEKARAEFIEELAQKGNNETFKRKEMPKNDAKKDGYGTLDGNNGHTRGYGVKYDF